MGDPCLAALPKRRRTAALLHLWWFEAQKLARQRLGVRLSAATLAGSLPFRDRLKLVVHPHGIRLEPVDGPDHRRRSRALEPGSRAPRILVGHWHQPVTDRVLTYVVEARQIGPLVGQLRFAVVVSDLAAWRAIEAVNPAGGPGVQHRKHIGQIGRVGRIER
jgi:hypothetical protein